MVSYKKRFAALAVCLALPLIAQQPPAGGRGRGPQSIKLKPEELGQIKSKSEQIDALVASLKSKHADAALIGDVEVYGKAGHFLLEFPELFNNQNAIDHAMVVLDQGIERGKQLQAGQSPWTSGKSQIHAYYSEIDGSVQPYHISLPENYDPAKPTRLYVWMHGRQNNTTESEFLFAQQAFHAANPPVADEGQIQID